LVSHGLRPVVTDEPDALIGHVRVCGGSGGKPLLLPGTATRQKAARDAGVHLDHYVSYAHSNFFSCFFLINQLD
jgi:hypothetical protein